MNKFLLPKKQLLNKPKKNYTSEKEITLDHQVLYELGYNIDLSNYKILKNGEIVTNLDIPDSYVCNGTLNKITKIGNSVFYKNESLESVKIPDSVTEIEFRAFSDCTSLKDIIFSNNLIKISDSAFLNCGSLKNITLPNSLLEIGECVFKWCGELNIIVPDTVNKIGEQAFSGCNVTYRGHAIGSPWEANYLNGKKEKGSYKSNFFSTFLLTALFLFLSAKIYDIYLYSKNIYYVIQSIVTLTFILLLVRIWRDKKFDIKEMKLDNTNLILLGYRKVNNLLLSEDGRNITSLNIPNICEKNGEKYKITKIAYGTFSGCQNLTEVKLPNSIKTIGGSAFLDCINLKTINIPDSVELIGEQAFSGCKLLTDVNISNDVEIQKDAFAFCCLLPLDIQKIINDKITYRGVIIKTNEQLAKQIRNIFLGIIGILVLLFIIDRILFLNNGNSGGLFLGCSISLGFPFLLVFAYIFTIWPNRCELNKQTLKNLGYKKVSEIDSIEIPNIHTVKVRYQERRQGPYKTRLDKYKILRIGNNVFKNCINLKSVKIPDSVSEIGKNAFKGCTGLVELIVPDSVTKIEENAFLGVENIIYNGTAKGAPWGAKSMN